MNAQTEKFLIDGPVGKIEVALDRPSAGSDGTALRGIALVAHPHPLFGGTMDNKVAQTLARTLVQLGKNLGHDIVDDQVTAVESPNQFNCHIFSALSRARGPTRSATGLGGPKPQSPPSPRLVNHQYRMTHASER